MGHISEKHADRFMSKGVDGGNPQVEQASVRTPEVAQWEYEESRTRDLELHFYFGVLVVWSTLELQVDAANQKQRFELVIEQRGAVVLNVNSDSKGST